MPAGIDSAIRLRDQPVFIVVGCVRSGTSFFFTVMSETMNTTFSSELQFVVPYYKKLHRYGNLDSDENLRRLVGDVHSEFVFDHFARIHKHPTTSEEILERVTTRDYSGILHAVLELFADKQDKRYLAYKQPRDGLYMPLLSTLFPTAKFIHIVRDARDVALSLLRMDWGETNLYSACRYWDAFVEKCHVDGLALGVDRYLEFRYEDLLTKPKDTASAIASFVNLGQQELVLRPEDMHEYVERNAKRERVYAWKDQMIEHDVFICEAAAQRSLRRFGYELRNDGMANVSPVTAGFYRTVSFAGRLRNAIRRRLQQVFA